MGSSRSRSRTHQSHQSVSQVHSPARSPSIASQEDDLHENGVNISTGDVSPGFSIIHPTQSQSQSGSSNHPHDFIQVVYPNELEHGSDSASRLDHHDRPQQHLSRSNSERRRSHAVRRSHPVREPLRTRTRDLQDHSHTESGDSADDFIAQAEPYDPLRSPSQIAAHPHGYHYPNPSSFATYPQIPHSSQVVPIPSQPLMAYHPYPHGQPMQQYPPPSAYGGAYSQVAPSHLSAPYASPYHSGAVVGHPASAAGGYFHQYPPHYAQQYPQHYQQYGGQLPPPMPYQDYRPPPQIAASPPAISANTSADRLEKTREADPEDMFRRLRDLMKEERAQDELTKEQQAMERAKEEQRIREQALRQAEEQARQDAMREEEAKRIREQALLQAAEKARADAANAAARAEEERRIREEAIVAAEKKARADAAAFQERVAAEQRIRDEARQEAIRAYEEQVRKAAEQAAREQMIRKEAAEAALRAAAEEAAAKAERAAFEKRIADEAAAAAKSAAEKDAADAAAAAKEEAKKASEEAEAKLKEAEQAAAKAQAEAEEAEKKAAARAPPDKKPPVRFKDAIGRTYNFPWERCRRWRDMEGLIVQAFYHIDGLSDVVQGGRYDLIGPDKEIIMPNYWESTVEPDMQITMMLWPVPEPKKEEEEVIVPVDDFGGDGILNMDDILNPSGSKKKPKKKKPGAIANWMLGGAASRPSRSLKGDKKPEVAAAWQHGATQQASGCTLM